MPSLPLRTFSVQLRLAETNEIFSLPRCQNDLALKMLRSHLELLTGIPLHFQRLQYLDEVDLPDESTFKDNDIVPGGTITMRIWRQDGWGELVAAAAKGETMKLACLGVTEDSAGTTPHAELLGPEQKKEWVAHRAFVALFVASHRGHVETVKFLLRHEKNCALWPAGGIASFRMPCHAETMYDIFTGANLHSTTPLGRTALHVAAVAGRCDCVELLLSYGARALSPDSEGQTAVSLARLWGQKLSERTMVRFQQRKRSPGAVPPAGAVDWALQQASGPMS
ncbi:PREDICTED: ankyrin repeat domain-containing protein 60 [Phaethon lepturus]|uniref:ankyrin repeat domain-containing protein 60 n=1 Tax=Phaethon lepturus TaxID=97097 RepID=UPI000530AC9C|nr:PREDICTED: ankyrin repeat domain-containing protein 60 [Phaethon lepturus]